MSWLNVTDASASEWWYTWLVFQPQYYNMPHLPGARVESASTLGRKCWAFAYLAQRWGPLKPKLQAAMLHADYALKAIEAYDAAVPFTMGLCPKVMANCFVNATYRPGLRNGTCPAAVGRFYVGYEWENGNNNVQARNDSIAFPFPRYTQTDAWRASACFCFRCFR